MKKITGLFVIIGLFILSGCFDTIEETTINDDGSGVLTNSVDMGKVISVFAAMGGDEKMKDVMGMKIDTTILLKDVKDSLKKLDPAEKKLIEKGKVQVIMNVEKEKFSVAVSVPFTKTSDIAAINSVLEKSSGPIIKMAVEKIMPEEEKAKMKSGGADMEEMDNKGAGAGVSSYFDMSYDKNKMSRKINKTKYAKAQDDESMKSLKEMGQMGMPMTLKTVINLPKPAKKAEGKGITLSADKKKVTIEGTLEDFLEDPAAFEYEIEY